MGKKSKKGQSRAGRAARPAAGQSKLKGRSRSVSSQSSREDMSAILSIDSGVPGSKAPVVPPANVVMNHDDKENSASTAEQNMVDPVAPPAVSAPVPEDASTADAVIAPPAVEKKESPVVAVEPSAVPETPVSMPPHEPVTIVVEKKEEEPLLEIETPNMEPHVLVLVSNQALKREVVANQQKAFTILDAAKIPYQTVDGSDPNHKDQRNQLFGISGLRAEYPQFFLVNEFSTEFFGDWDKFATANECGTLAHDLGFPSAPSVWSTNLREAVSREPEAPAVLDVTMDESQSTDDVKDVAAMQQRGIVDLSAPATQEAAVKQKDCACTIL